MATSTSTSTPGTPATSSSEVSESASGTGKSASGLATSTVVAPGKGGAAERTTTGSARASASIAPAHVRRVGIDAVAGRVPARSHCSTRHSVARAPRAMASTHTILVVEDDQDVREAMVQVLEAEGYAAVAAADGEDALTQLQG